MKSSRRPAQPAGKPDTVGAIELVILTLDGKFSRDLLRGMDSAATITGLIHLVTILGEKIIPDMDGDKEVFRAALRDLQAWARLDDLFGTEGERTDQ